MSLKLMELAEMLEYTGGYASEDGSKLWLKNGKYHRETGPAIEWANCRKEWYLDGVQYCKLDLKDHVVLDCYKGTYGIMWYKLLDEDNIIEYPDIPGLITK